MILLWTCGVSIFFLFRCLRYLHIFLSVLQTTNWKSVLPRFVGFAEKNLKCTGAKVPRFCLFSVLKNKNLVRFSGVESLVLADVARSLWYDLKREEKFSDVSCMTCARSLARFHASLAKLFAGINDGVSSGGIELPKPPGKRRTQARSPTGVTLSPRRPNHPETTSLAGKSWRFLALSFEENTDCDNEEQELGVSSMSDKIASWMKLPKNAHQTIVKISFTELTVLSFSSKTFLFTGA